MDLTARGRVPEVGITASDATISFRIAAEGATEEEALRLIEPTAALIHERFGSLILGEGTDDVAEALVAQLARTGSTLATAESCTGGLIAQMITAIPGVSSYYLGGVVTYANEAKSELLGVPGRAARGARGGQPGGRRGHGRGRPDAARRHGGHQHDRRRRARRRHAREARGPRLSRAGHRRRHPDPPARHGARTTPRLHPAPGVQGRPQLGEIGVAGRKIVRPALAIR